MEMIVARSLLDGIRRAAAATPGREICGLLFGGSDRIDHAEAVANVAPAPETSFELDPAALIAAYKAERAGGPRVIGCYHSHPNGRAEPSARDLAAAEPGGLWLIVGGTELRAWRAEPGAFREVKLIAT
jgi:proteasome lid subunit RPN8/RPN11